MDNIYIYLAILVLVNLSIYFTVNSAISTFSKQIKRMNSKIDKIAEKLDVEFENIDDELRELIKADKKVQAIKTYREFSGANLIEAKQYIDSLM
ncbi:50S ribosomal protein L7/L12 [Clostridiaceae bacterium 14S0207]|nr:50S ribosomal protein L7/L12 [Clostridiaceae bacterium 14S0207]